MHELRVYTSFAEFEREERHRLGLADQDCSHAPAVDLVKNAPVARRVTCIVTRVTPASLRAEGILEIGCATATSVLFVRTKVKLHLLHSTYLPDRDLDDYAVGLAVNWIEGHGLPSYEVARNLGVNETTLRTALTKAGYERVTPSQREGLVHARASRKPGRRGRLVRVSDGAGATIWQNDESRFTWHTWDDRGTGGENSEATSLDDAKRHCMAAIVRQGWAPGGWEVRW